MVDRNHWSVRDGVAELLDHGVADEFPAHTLAIGMLRLLGADYASFSEIDISRAHGARMGYAPRAAADRFPAANVGALMAYRPVHRHYAATLSMCAERVTGRGTSVYLQFGHADIDTVDTGWLIVSRFLTTNRARTAELSSPRADSRSRRPR